MSIVIPDTKITFPGKTYGMKVIDPVDNSEIFNAKYPIFGSDVSSEIPQIVSKTVRITNSSGLFSEPATPSFTYTPDGQWKSMTFPQIKRRLVATIPHGQKIKPNFMVTGSAKIKATMRLRYYATGSISHNTIYIPSFPSSGFYERVIRPRLGGPNALTIALGAGDYSYTFNNVGELGNITWTDAGSNFQVEADDTNIYIYLSLNQTLQYQQVVVSSDVGFRRYLKGWSDFSGSTYSFTFYILPYNGSEDIFIR